MIHELSVFLLLLSFAEGGGCGGGKRGNGVDVEVCLGILFHFSFPFNGVRRHFVIDNGLCSKRV